MLTIIFSKDRPLQLDATLRSFMLHCQDLYRVSIQIIFRTSNESYRESYQVLEQEYSSYSNILFILENDFRQQVLHLLKSDEHVLWLVDDNIFVRNFKVADFKQLLENNKDALAYSLRLGENTTYFYMLDKPQSLPIFAQLTPDTLKYNWTYAKYDFGYPLEVSSSLYRTTDMLRLLTPLPFYNPNSLEEEMARQVSRFQKSHPYLLCSKTSVTFCNPINKVQNTIPQNRAGGSYELSAESLLVNYLKGLRIDTAAFDGFTSNSCHQEVALTFVKNMNACPKISVIIPCYNYAHYLPEAVESVLNQTFKDFEIIIVNDGSTDNTSSVGRELIRKFGGNRIQFVEKKNGGVADARNFGLRLARAQWVMPLDSDDMLDPTFFEKAMALIEKDRSIDIVFSNLQMFGTNTGRWAPSDYSEELILKENTIPYAAIYRKKLLEAVGEYSRILGKLMQLEDWEFWIRVSRLQPNVVRIPEYLFLYRVHGSNIYYSLIQKNMDLAKSFTITANPEIYTIEQIHNACMLISKCPPEICARVIATAERYPDESLPFFWLSLISRYNNHSDTATKLLATAINVSKIENSKSKERINILSKFQLSSKQISKEVIVEDGRFKNNTCSFLTICMVASVGPISPIGSTGGLETAMRQTAAALARRGHRVALVGNLQAKPGCYEGVEYLPFEEWSKGDYPTFYEGVNILAFASGPDLGSYRIAGKGGAKVVLFHHQQLSFLTRADPLALLNRETDATICVSKAVRENLIRDGVSLEKLTVIANGVDLNIFYPRKVQREPHRILFAGALVPDKNVHLLIKAFMNISPLFPDAELHICGSASLWAEQEYIDREAVKRVSTKVIFHGTVTQEELSVQYSRATLCVIPSRFESFSLVSLEAQACGCVPLVANVGGIAETIVPGVTGFIYHPNDVDTLANNLSVLLGNPNLLEVAGRSAATFVAENFSWDRAAADYEKMFNMLLSNKTTGANLQKTISCPNLVPIVSVVIPCYNYAHYLPEAVTSVIKQTFQNFEIIIVNDGSADNTIEVATRLIEFYHQHSIRFLNQPYSGHPAYSRNHGIAEALGTYILPLDADDKINPTMLEKCVTLLESDTSISIAYTDRMDFDRGDQVVAALDYDFDLLKYQNHISYCALFRKEIWEAVGGYKKIGYEDWNFWIEAGAKGFIAKRISEPLFMYRRHNTGRFQKDSVDMERVLAALKLQNRHLYTDSEIQHASEIIGSYSPIVSVIVPTYNRLDMLKDAIQSILEQTYQGFEIIVVNDAGQDVSSVVLGFKSPNITCLSHEINKGLAAARNTGIRNAKGKYIALLDDDDCFYKDHLETTLEELRSGWKVVYTDAVRVEYAKVGGCYELRRKHVPYSIDFDRSKLLIGNIAPVNCFVFDRETAINAGLFDETFSVLEDWEFWLRLSALAPFHHIKKETVQVNWRTDGTTMTSSRQAEFVTNRSRIYQQYQIEIAEIPDRDVIIQELNAIWSQDNSKDMDCVPVPKVSQKAVSIIILTFNELKYTRECVESIKKHTPEPHEIIFVNNGSTDGTSKWLKNLVKNNSHYKLIENKENLGFSKGCNQGIEASSGDYILLLNNDVVVTENWLAGMLECVNNAPDIGIVGPMTNSISGPQKVPLAGYSSIDDLAVHARNFREKNRHRRIAYRRVVGFCMLFRRQLIKEIGLFDESFGSGNFEDDDFCLRASLTGYRNVIAGDVFIHHYGSRSFAGNRIDYGSSLSGNRKIFTEKWSGKDAGERFGKKLIIENAISNADDLYRQGHIEKAAASLLEVLKQEPGDRCLYFKFAEMLIDTKRYNDALEILESAQKGGADARQFSLLGYCEEGLGHDEKAQEYAERALAIDPSMPLALNIAGVVAYKKGEKDTAEGLFKKAIDSDPGFGESYTNLGSLRWASGEHIEALNLFERGFILSPTVADVVTAYYSAVAETYSFARAEPVFREARALYPNDKRIAFLMIAVVIKQEKHELAMHDIEQAMMQFGIDDGILAAALEVRAKAGPLAIRSGSPRRSLSLCMIVKNEELNLSKCLMSVKPVVDEIIVVDTGSTDKTKAIASALGAKVFDFTWTQDFSEARNYSLSKASGDWILVLDADEIISSLDHEKLKKLINTVAGKRVAYIMVTRNYTDQAGSRDWSANEGGYIHEEVGRGWIPSPKVRLFVNDKRINFVNPVHELVEPTLEKLGIKLKTCDVPVHHYGRLNRDKLIAKGKEYYRLGIAKIEKTKDPYNALRELAIQAAEIGEYAEAVNVWEKVIELKPNDAVAFMNMGFAFLMMQQYNKVVEHSKKAMALDPHLREAALNYAAAELIAGDVGKAIATLEGILQKHPDYPPAMGRLVAACMISGRKEEGLRYLDRLNTKGFDCAGMLEEQSRAFFSIGKIEQATVLLQAAIEKGMTNGRTQAQLAEYREKMKKGARSHGSGFTVQGFGNQESGLGVSSPTVDCEL